MSLSRHVAETASTLIHRLADRAQAHGEQVAVSFTAGDNAWSSVTYAELASRAMAIGERLRSHRRPGEQPQFVLIALPNGIDYVASFYGCLAAGAVAVTFYPPALMTSRAAVAFTHRLEQIMQDCRPSVLVLPGDLVERVRDDLGEAALRGVTLIAAEDLPQAGGPDLGNMAARPNDLALLQYTSGSTSVPKGVMVHHANLAHNVTGIAKSLGCRQGEQATTWLPLFHDMGLIGMLCQPLWAGMTVNLLTPPAFVRRPYLWLDTMSRTRSVITMAPNFAYDLCVRRITDAQRETLDLSHVRHAVNAAEPVRPTTIEAFTKTFERHGFNPHAMMPAYGMAENTLAVTVSQHQHDPVLREVDAGHLRLQGVVRPAHDAPATVLVGCGPDFTTDSETVIVDPTTATACPDGTVGEIWITGPSVAQGYWGKAQESAETFAAELPDDGRRFLRTGDLGVKIDEVMYIVGRVKDTIIRHGVNHYPQDLEYTAEQADPAVHPGGSVALATPHEDGELVVLVCELAQYGRDLNAPAVITAVRRAVVEEHGLQVDVISLVRKGQVPKTTSGKVRRRASAERWLAGEFDTVATWPNTISTQEAAP